MVGPLQEAGDGVAQPVRHLVPRLRHQLQDGGRHDVMTEGQQS